MTTIDEFIEARLREDEEIAGAASPGTWEISELHSGDKNERVIVYVSREGVWHPVTDQGYEGDGGASVQDAEHIARQQPKRVLRQCAALRAILEAADWIGHDAGDPGASAAYARPFLKSVASIWSSHPDFREEWTA